MMASNLLSRILPSATDETLGTESTPRQPRRSSTSTEGQHDMDIDEENFGAYFEPQDLEHLLEEASGSQTTTDSRAVSPEAQRKPAGPPGINTASRAAGWKQPAQTQRLLADYDDDVPQSLLLEGGPMSPQAIRRTDGLPPPVPGPSTRQTRAQWDTTQRQQRLHDDVAGVPASTWRRAGQFNIRPKDKALWLWVNQTDLDAYMKDVYEYYRGHGIYSMLLKRLLTLLQSAFVVSFMTFMGWCIDYSKLSSSHQMSEVLVSKCTSKIHGIWIFALWVFASYWIYSFYTMVTDIPRLRALQDFYEHLLDIPDRDIQTVEWQHVVSRIMALRDLNLATASNLSPETRKLLDSKSRQRLDAIDIASRLMRRVAAAT